jgi:hypothetical protein
MVYKLVWIHRGYWKVVNESQLTQPQIPTWVHKRQELQKKISWLSLYIQVAAVHNMIAGVQQTKIWAVVFFPQQLGSRPVQMRPSCCSGTSERTYIVCVSQNGFWHMVMVFLRICQAFWAMKFQLEWPLQTSRYTHNCYYFAIYTSWDEMGQLAAI